MVCFMVNNSCVLIVFDIAFSDKTMIDIQEVEQIWASLDKLAKTDPKGYVEYIKSMKKQEENSRVIQPGYSVRATSNDKSLHMINICQCKAVKPSPDNYNIPTLMSEKRSVVEDSKTIYVYDAVFHPSVLQNKAIEKDVLDLAVGCILELFSVTLMPESTSRTDGVYFGPYGWDDRTGKPLTTKEVEEQSLFGKHLFGPTELKEILTRAPEEVKDEIALELNLQPVTPSTKPMIEEIKSTSTTTLIDDFEPVVQMVTPKCTIKTFDERIEFHIYMPEIEDGREIRYTKLENGFKVEAGRYRLEERLCEDYDSQNHKGRFNTLQRILKLKYQKKSTS
ncbi:hypothetical protein BC833DRAFT_659136 [Globomyces pollinis-pini]|nr:hypothetical protein BC833DRAFT_659136 [Globomyces pollinis-pini]